MATLSSKMLPAGVATLAQGALADTSVQPNDSPAFDGLTVNGNAYPSDGALSNRNLVINGAMQVAQRGTSSSDNTSGYFTCDRVYTTQNIGTRTFTQESDGPVGFSKSFKAAMTVAAATGSASFSQINYRIEGQDLQRLAKGTASAESVTLSFWVKSNLTGTYIFELDDDVNSRNINASYTVDVAGTWEYKTITFAGDTSGAIVSDNALGFKLIWWLDAGTDFSSGTLATAWESTVNANRAVGQVNFAGTIGNYFQITGIQLEAGDTATPFEHRGFGHELALCQRYFYQLVKGASQQVGMAFMYTTTSLFSVIPLPTAMRATPTLTVVAGTNFYGFLRNGATDFFDGLLIGSDSTNKVVELTYATGTSGTAGQAGWIRTVDSTAAVAFDAEL